jgi:hypothetical protein
VPASPLLWAGERGRLSLTYQNQGYRNYDQDNEYSSTLNSIYLNYWQGLGKGSSLNFSINYYFNRGSSEVTSYNLGLQDISLGKYKADFDFGTISYPLSGLPYFGSFNSAAYRGLKGGKITLRSEKSDFILFGGKLYSDFGYRNQSSRIYGARAIFRPNRRWTLGPGWMKILDMPSGDFRESTGDYDVFSLDSSFMAAKNLYLLGDFRYVFDQSKNHEDGFSVKTGTYYNTGNLSFEIFYNYISPKFPNLGNIFFQGHKGVTIVGQYRLASWLSLFGSLDTFNEQPGNIPGKSPGNFMTYRVGSTLSPRAIPQISAIYNKSIREFPREGAVGSASNGGTEFDMIFLSLSQQYRRFSWSIYYNRGNFDNPREKAGNYRLNRLSWNLRRSFPTGHYIYLTGDLDQTTWPTADPDNKNFNIQLGASLMVKPYLHLNIQGDYSIDKYSTAAGENRHLGFGGGVIYRLKPLQVNCSLRYQYGKMETALTGATVRYSHQVFLSITKDFQWGVDTFGLNLPGRSGVPRTGKIKGRVFVDINQNDFQEQGEEGLEGIYILVDNYQAASTDKNGGFTLSPLPVGTHRISLDLRNVPAYYEAARETTGLILKKGETGTVNLTVIPVGLLAGQVILDLNENNAADKDEPVLIDVQVNLFKEDQLLRREYTNSKGIFTFDNLRPGSYIIKVDEESIYEKYNGTDKATIQVTVKPWEEKKDLLLLLNEYKKTRVKKVLE